MIAKPTESNNPSREGVHEYAEAILLTIPYPLVVVEKEGRIVRANRAFHEVFRTTEEAVVGAEFSELPNVEWSMPGIEKHLLRTILRGDLEIDEANLSARLGDGAEILLQVTARPLQPATGLEPMLLVCFEEITRRKRMEEERQAMLVELEEARARLEARVEARTLQLAQSLGQLREVSERLCLAHESEQRRIARELHDQVGQDLTALRLVFNRASRDETNPARVVFKEAEKVTEEAIQNVRNICGTLRPQMLDDLGLVAALTWHLRNFGERSGIEIAFEQEGMEEKRLTPILQSAIFRVIQEGLTNVARHAQTRSATVVLWMTAREVLFRVQDSGCGFNMNSVRSGSNGISSMRERISLVHGECEIYSSPGRGTTIQALIPLIPPLYDQDHRRGRPQSRSQRTDVPAGA